jgi:hypothetical protein
MKTRTLFLLAAPLLAWGGGNGVAVGYERVDFDHSVKKDRGWRASLFGHTGSGKNGFEGLVEKSRIDTFKPPAPKDLQVTKIGLRYLRAFEDSGTLALSFATIDDNLMHETDGGKIYGLAYQKGPWRIAQYLSDYRHFDVWQTEAGYRTLKSYEGMKVGAEVLAKYIHLEDRKSNPFSRNARPDYFTPGFFLSCHTRGWHARAGAFFGRRIFAVMRNGLIAQHHAMEFTRTWMAAVAKDLGQARLTLRYVYQKADEIPAHNDGVTVQSVWLQWEYGF